MASGRAVVAAAALLAGCFNFGDNNTGPGEQIDVTGTWEGELRVALGADTLVGLAEFVFDQDANSGDLTGTLEFAPLGDLVMLEESQVHTTQVDLHTRHVDTGTDDCHEYAQRWDLRSFAGELRLTTMTGDFCEPGGAGGQTVVRQITGASGTFIRR